MNVVEKTTVTFSAGLNSVDVHLTDEKLTHFTLRHCGSGNRDLWFALTKAELIELQDMLAVALKEGEEEPEVPSEP